MELLDRLDAHDQIRMLAARYALALDSRDVATLVSLFVDDVQTGDGGVGHEALARWFDPVLRPYSTTFHLIGNHVIDLQDDDHATGVVYCRPEHEVGDLWVVMPMQYWDRYERVSGRWCFAQRRPHSWYYTDWAHPPVGPLKMRVPGQEPQAASLPGAWPSWNTFWAA